MAKNERITVVSPELFKKLNDGYSGDTIPNGKVRGVFEIEGSLWVCTGGTGRDANLEAYMVQPIEQWEGPSYTCREMPPDPERGYQSIRVKHRGKEYVFTNNKITVAQGGTK